MNIKNKKNKNRFRLTLMCSTGAVLAAGGGLVATACATTTKGAPSAIVKDYSTDESKVVGVEFRSDANALVRIAPPLQAIYGTEYTPGLENQYESPIVYDTNYRTGNPVGAAGLKVTYRFKSKTADRGDLFITLPVKIIKKRLTTVTAASAQAHVLGADYVLPQAADFAPGGRYEKALPEGFVFSEAVPTSYTNVANNDVAMVKNLDVGARFGLTWNLSLDQANYEYTALAIPFTLDYQIVLKAVAGASKTLDGETRLAVGTDLKNVDLPVPAGQMANEGYELAAVAYVDEFGNAVARQDVKDKPANAVLTVTWRFTASAGYAGEDYTVTQKVRLVVGSRFLLPDGPLGKKIDLVYKAGLSAVPTATATQAEAPVPTAADAGYTGWTETKPLALTGVLPATASNYVAQYSALNQEISKDDVAALPVDTRFAIAFTATNTDADNTALANLVYRYDYRIVKKDTTGKASLDANAGNYRGNNFMMPTETDFTTGKFKTAVPEGYFVANYTDSGANRVRFYQRGLTGDPSELTYQNIRNVAAPSGAKFWLAYTLAKTNDRNYRYLVAAATIALTLTYNG